MTSREFETRNRIRAGGFGGRADFQFIRACKNAGLDPKDALIGSPLLNLQIAWDELRQRKQPASERAA